MAVDGSTPTEQGKRRHEDASPVRQRLMQVLALNAGLVDNRFLNLVDVDLVQLIGQLNQRFAPVIGIDPLTIGIMQIEDVLNGPEYT